MGFPLKPRKVSYRTLEKTSGLTPVDFKAFWDHVREKLHEPANRIGYLGVKKCTAEDYRGWLDGFIADGIGELGWGNGITEWVYGSQEDQKYITKYMHLLVGYCASACRRFARNNAASQTGAAILTFAAAPSEVSPESTGHSESPCGAPVVFTDRCLTTYEALQDILLAQCRHRFQMVSSLTRIQVFVNGWGDFMDVTDEASWDKAKDLLSGGPDAPGLHVTVKYN